MLHLLSAPFVQLALITAFVLAGIHAYLGFHVVSRGVIFVDLSLAQAAAFGSAVALAIGFSEHSTVGYFISLAFTMLGAGIISVARTKDDRVPHEAFIGIIYGAFTAGAILMLSNQPEGAEHLNHLLSGALLTVTPNQLLKIVILYSVVGTFHWFLRRRFFLISSDRQSAHALGWKVGFWDFLFYASFGIVVTSSVEVAGVIVVFSLLVIPSVVGVLFSQKQNKRLAVGWVVGFLGALFGVLISLQYDLPVGPSIITALAGVLLLSVPILALRRTNSAFAPELKVARREKSTIP
jgi:zinc/manganese transport system permease protein